jgi:hypothetical protein
MLAGVRLAKVILRTQMLAGRILIRRRSGFGHRSAGHSENLAPERSWTGILKSVQ